MTCTPGKTEPPEMLTRVSGIITLAGFLLVMGQVAPSFFIQIDPISDRYVGDRFTITAATSLPEGEVVLFQVSPSSPPVQGSQAGQPGSVSGSVVVTRGSGNLNRISFDVDTSSFTPGRYTVKAEAVKQKASHTAGFVLLEPAPATTIIPKTPASPVTTVMPAFFIRIDPIADRYAGDRIAITAATSLPEGGVVLFQVYPSSSLLEKSQAGQFSGVTGSVRVVKGDGDLNRLSFNVDTSLFGPGEHIVTAEAVNRDASHTIRFMLLGSLPHEPFIGIDPVGTRYAGTRFTITATTNLPEGEVVLFQISPSSSTPQVKGSGQNPGASGSARIMKGEGSLNRLSLDVDTAPFTPGEYQVTAQAVARAATATALFTLLPPATTVQPDGSSVPVGLIIPAIIFGIVIGALALLWTGHLTPGGAGSGLGLSRAAEPEMSVAIRQGIEPGEHIPENIEIRVDVETGIEPPDRGTEGR